MPENSTVKGENPVSGAFFVDFRGFDGVKNSVRRNAVKMLQKNEFLLICYRQKDKFVLYSYAVKVVLRMAF